MSKKKTTKLKPDKSLTDDQIAALVPRLLGTSQNVYWIVEIEYGVKADDSTFDRLAAAGAKRCDECGMWQDPNEEYASAEDGICNECMNRIDGDYEA